jgi:hypothetical protein
MAAPSYPTSGTTAFNLDFATIAEEAFERTGTELRSGYDLRTARRSLGLLLIEWANRGINMWTIDGPYSVPMLQGVATYLLPSDTVDLLDHYIRTGAGNASTQTDLSITRIAEPTYATIPNKLTPGRPIQVWVNRQSGANNTNLALPSSSSPQFTVWPVPPDSTTFIFVYYRLRRIQDVGSGINGPDVPWRFLPALCAGLAYYLSIKLPLKDAQIRVPALKMMYEEAWDMAATEDSEKASIRLVPRQSFLGNG